jgi:hypothetical protein
MSSLRLKAVLYAGQARATKIGMNAGLSTEITRLQSRRTDLQNLLLTLVSEEARNSCTMLLQNDERLLAMTENEFHQYVGRIVLTPPKHDERLDEANLLLAIGDLSRERARDMAPQQRLFTFLKTKDDKLNLTSAIINHDPANKARILAIWKNTNYTKGDRDAAFKVAVTEILKSFITTHPGVAEGVREIMNLTNVTDLQKRVLFSRLVKSQGAKM